METSSEPKFVSDLNTYVEFPRFNINPAKLFRLFLEQNNELNVLRREIHELTQENEELRSHFTCWYIEKSKENLSDVNPRKTMRQAEEEPKLPKPQIRLAEIQNQVVSTQTETSQCQNHDVPQSTAANLTIRVEIVTKTNTNTESVQPTEEVIVKTVELSQSASPPQLAVLQQLIEVQKPVANVTENNGWETYVNGVDSKTVSKQNKAYRAQIENHEAANGKTDSMNTENPFRGPHPDSADYISTGNSNETTTRIQTAIEKFYAIRNNNGSAIQNMIETKRGPVYLNRPAKSRTDFHKTLNEMRNTRFRTLPVKDPSPNSRDTEVQVKREDMDKTSTDPTPSQVNCAVDANSRTTLVEGPVQVCQKRRKTLKDIFTRSKPQPQSSKVLETETVTIPIPSATPVKLESAWAKSRNKRNYENSAQVPSTSGNIDNEKVNCESVKGFISAEQPGNQIPKFQKTRASPPESSAPPYRSSRIRQPKN